MAAICRACSACCKLSCDAPQGTIEAELEELKAQCKAIRVLVHTQIKKVSNWGQKKAHMLEVQVCALPAQSCATCIAAPQQNTQFASHTAHVCLFCQVTLI